MRARRGRIPAVIARIAGVYDEYTHAPTLAQQMQRVYERQLASHFFPGHISHGQAALHLEDLIGFFVVTVAHRRKLPEEFTVLVGAGDAHLRRAAASARAADSRRRLGNAADSQSGGPGRRLREALPQMVAALKRDPLRWYRESKLEPLEELRMQPNEDEHQQMMQQQHLRSIWVHFANMALGVWLITRPVTLGYAKDPDPGFNARWPTILREMAIGGVSFPWTFAARDRDRRMVHVHAPDLRYGRTAEGLGLRKRAYLSFSIHDTACKHAGLYIYFEYISKRGPTFMKTAKLFRNGESQAVRLPKEFRFEGKEVLIRRVGSAVILLPKTKSWDTLIGSLAKFPPDFMADREQPREEDRRETF